MMIRFSALMARLFLALGLTIATQFAHAADKREAFLGQLSKPADASVSFWLENSLDRGYVKTSTNLSLLAARNSKISFQSCVRNERAQPTFQCKIEGADDFKPRIRFVRLPPLPHFTPNTDSPELEGFEFGPGSVPDPLLSQTSAKGRTVD